MSEYSPEFEAWWNSDWNMFETDHAMKHYCCKAWEAGKMFALMDSLGNKEQSNSVKDTRDETA